MNSKKTTKMSGLKEFEKWWYNNTNQKKAEERFGKRVEQFVNEADPDVTLPSLYYDTVKLMAHVSRMHLDSK